MVSSTESAGKTVASVDFLAVTAPSPSDPLSFLDSLNIEPYILGGRITKITKAPDGRRCSYWLYFENSVVAYVPDIEDLCKVDRMELILSRAFERSILLYPPKLSRQWKAKEANWIMEAAIPAVLPVDTLNSIIDELLADYYLTYSDDEEMTGRKAAQIFANQSPKEYLDRRYVIVRTWGGIFLYRPALSIVLAQRFNEKPLPQDIGAALRRLEYHPTHPYPAVHSGVNGSAEIYNTGVRMWFKPQVGEIPSRQLSILEKLPNA